MLRVLFAGEEWNIFQDETNDANVEPLIDLAEGLRYASKQRL